MVSQALLFCGKLRMATYPQTDHVYTP